MMKTLAELVTDHENLTKALGLTKIETAQERTALCDDNDGYAWFTVPEHMSQRDLGDRWLVSAVWLCDPEAADPNIPFHRMVVVMKDAVYPATMEVWCEFTTVSEYF